jgi:type VI secretion system secreted protein VgrG
MDWHAQKDLKNLVLHDHTETIGNNQKVFIKRESSRVVEKNQDYEIGGNQKRTVGRDRIIKIDKDRTHDIGGNETIKITGNSDTSVNGEDYEDVGGARMTEAGNDESGSIDRHVQEYFTRFVGGAYIAMAGSSISHEAGEKLDEIVSGCKITVATEQSITESVGGNLETKVTGLTLRCSKDDMSISAKKTEVEVGACVSLGSAERVELRSKEIEIEASASITLQAGGLLIKMTPGEVTITGPIKEKSVKKITVRGNSEKLTP